MDTARHGDLINFYAMLDKLEKNIGGARKLADCSGRLIWPKRGVYFFRESGEQRFDSGVGPRIVRVGTHALKAASTIWRSAAAQSQSRAQSSSELPPHWSSCLISSSPLSRCATSRCRS
jgi:hypothetical protein